MTPERLAAALRAQAEGSFAVEAAVGLLIGHRRWLGRPDFVGFVDVAASFTDERVVMASVDWEAVLAANLPASSSEARMLAVAAELAGVDTGRSFQDLLCGLDRVNTILVARAVLHAQRGPDTTPVTVTPFRPSGPRADRTDFRPDRCRPPTVEGGAEPEGPGL